jgi:hypothetical protein
MKRSNPTEEQQEQGNAASTMPTPVTSFSQSFFKKRLFQ